MTTTTTTVNKYGLRFRKAKPCILNILRLISRDISKKSMCINSPPPTLPNAKYVTTNKKNTTQPRPEQENKGVGSSAKSKPTILNLSTYQFRLKHTLTLWHTEQNKGGGQIGKAFFPSYLHARARAFHVPIPHSFLIFSFDLYHGFDGLGLGLPLKQKDPASIHRGSLEERKSNITPRRSTPWVLQQF